MISKKEKDILDALKKGLIETKRVAENDFYAENERETPKCIYYLRSFVNNLFVCDNHREDYKNGNGGELSENNRWRIVPMASLRSSAALTWNIFGDDKTCQLNQAWGLSKGEYNLVYEWNKSETIHNHYANLDAYLHNGNCHLFVEMKMLEPLMRVHSFKSVDKYLEKDVCPKEFQNAIKCFQKKEPEFFDAFQMIKHLLAIYNYFKKLELKDSQKVVLLNCHWEPSEAYISNHTYGNRAISLQETYNLFNETAKRFKEMEASFMPLFKGIGVNIKLETCDHRKIIELVGKTDNKYLKRYDI